MNPERCWHLWAGEGEAQARADLIASLEELAQWTAARRDQPVTGLPPCAPESLPQALHFLRHRLRIRAEHAQLAARLPAFIAYARVCNFSDLGPLALDARRWHRRLHEHARLQATMDAL